MSSDTPALPTIPRPCNTPGCTTPTRNPGGRCDTHTRQHNQQTNERTAYYQSPEWRRLRKAVRDRDYNRCVVCTGTYRMAAHHIVARAEGGPDAMHNLVTLCHPCHSKIERGCETTAARVREHQRALGRSFF